MAPPFAADSAHHKNDKTAGRASSGISSRIKIGCSLRRMAGSARGTDASSRLCIRFSTMGNSSRAPTSRRVIVFSMARPGCTFTRMAPRTRPRTIHATRRSVTMACSGLPNGRCWSTANIIACARNVKPISGCSGVVVWNSLRSGSAAAQQRICDPTFRSQSVGSLSSRRILGAPAGNSERRRNSTRSTCQNQGCLLGQPALWCYPLGQLPR